MAYTKEEHRGGRSGERHVLFASASVDLASASTPASAVVIAGMGFVCAIGAA